MLSCQEKRTCSTYYENRSIKGRWYDDAAIQHEPHIYMYSRWVADAAARTYPVPVN